MNGNELRTFMYLVYLMIEGDDVVSDVLEMMHKYGYTDKDGFWNYDPEDDGN